MPPFTLGGVRIDVALPILGAATLEVSMSVRGVSQVGLKFLAFDVCLSGPLTFLQSLAYLGFSMSLSGRSVLESALFIFDSASLDFTTFPQSSAHTDPFTSTFDCASLEISLSPQHLSCLDILLSPISSLKSDFPLPALDAVHLGFTVSPRSSARLDSPLIALDFATSELMSLLKGRMRLEAALLPVAELSAGGLT